MAGVRGQGLACPGRLWLETKGWAPWADSHVGGGQGSPLHKGTLRGPRHVGCRAALARREGSFLYAREGSGRFRKVPKGWQRPRWAAEEGEAA